VKELSVLIKFDGSHLNEKSPNPIAEQTNVTLSVILTVTLLGLIVTIGGDTTKHKTLVASYASCYKKQFVTGFEKTFYVRRELKSILLLIVIATLVHYPDTITNWYR